MRVLILSRYQNTVHRGVESFVEELTLRLADKFEVDVWSGQNSDSFFKIIRGNYDVVIPTNGWGQSFKVSIGRLFSNYKMIITGHSGLGKGDLFNVAICQPNIFVGLTDYAIDLTDEEINLPLLQKISAKLRKVKTWALFTKVVKIPNGIDLNKFNPRGKKYTHGLKSPVVLSVGALSWYKHHENTINAVAKLPETILLIVGRGEERNALERLAVEKLGKDRFKMIETDYANIPDIYRSADVFTLPSWNREAFGIVYLEALATNLPVVAPNDPPRREIVGDAGILVDTSDATLFSAALKTALEKDWGDKPRNQAAKFSWEKIAEQYIKLIESLK